MKSTLFTAVAMAARLSLPAVLFVAPAEAQEPAAILFSVDAQPLASALAEFSRQADITVTASGRLTQDRQSPGFTGRATPIEALDALLQGTGLEAVEQGGALIIRQAESAKLLGIIKGRVLRADNRVPLRQVRVSIPGTTINTLTDRFGNFELEAPVGEYELRLEHPDYDDRTLPEVGVRADLALEMELVLQPATAAARPGEAVTLEEVVVTARYTENAVNLEYLASGIVDAIDFTQIARFDDSTVSTALTRIVGVNLEEGRFAIVRGMKSRYQSVYFNDGILPSSDPGRRDLAFDIFPASIMKGLSLQKTASPDVPGTATAGHIDMATKQVPDEPFFKISASTVFWDDVSDDVLRAEGGDTDWLGYDDGTRDMPEAVQAIAGQFYVPDGSSNDIYTPEQIEAAGEAIDHRDINIGESNPDVSLDLSGGKRWQLGEQSLGFISALRYSNKWTNRDLYDYSFGQFTDQETQEQYVQLTDYTRTWDSNNIIDLSAMLNLEWEPAQGHTLGWNNILLRHTVDSVEQEYSCEGCFDENADYVYYPGSDYAYIYDVDWIEEQVLGSQLWGSHRFEEFGGLKLDWLWLEAKAEFDRPDAKRYTWASTNLNTSPQLTSGSSNNRFEWEEMDEDSSSYRMDLSLPLFPSAPVSAVLSAGEYLLERERNGSEYGWYYSWPNPGQSDVITQEEIESQQPGDFFTDENICGSGQASSCDGIDLQVYGVLPDDDVGFVGRNYLVEQDTDAYYLRADLDFLEKLQASVGVRYEDFSIGAEMYEYSQEPLTPLLEEQFYLPSVALTLPFREQWQLRLAYSETVSWPEIFEIVPRSFQDYDTREVFQGNPDLEPAQIKNYDLRLEWYPGVDESVTLAYFYKDLTNPIENTFIGENEQYSSYSFDNVPSAKVNGWEFDASQVYSLGAGHELSLLFNYTDISSEVNLPEDTLEYDPNRPLQGQPDYLINFSIGYDHLPTDQQFTIAYNRRGEELAIVTNNEGVALDNNVYEQPYDDLKLIYKKGFTSGLSVLLSLENALGSERNLEYEQEGVPYLKYEVGTRAKLKLSYTF